MSDKILTNLSQEQIQEYITNLKKKKKNSVNKQILRPTTQRTHRTIPTIQTTRRPPHSRN